MRTIRLELLENRNTRDQIEFISSFARRILAVIRSRKIQSSSRWRFISLNRRRRILFHVESSRSLTIRVISFSLRAQYSITSSFIVVRELLLRNLRNMCVIYDSHETSFMLILTGLSRLSLTTISSTLLSLSSYLYSSWCRIRVLISSVTTENACSQISAIWEFKARLVELNVHVLFRNFVSYLILFYKFAHLFIEIWNLIIKFFLTFDVWENDYVRRRHRASISVESDDLILSRL